MPAVFLSYAREDLDRARQVDERLAARGFSVWRDENQLRAGQSWPKALGDAIAGSDVLLQLCSRHAAMVRTI
jgi:hypothetical protein